MDDFLLIDKPKGMTSFDVIRHLRRKLGIKKIGHAGTLDPMATGLLILACGKSTKKLNDLIGLDKVYEAWATFGAKSDTYDAEGKIEEVVSKVPFGRVKHARPGACVFEKKLLDEMENFKGEIEQMPPIYSAVKIKGQKAYNLARKGKIEKLPESKKRKVQIFEFELQSLELPKAKFLIHCSKGTYIRSLIHDLGEKLGVGAYLSGLRRIQVGEYSVLDAEKL